MPHRRPPLGPCLLVLAALAAGCDPAAPAPTSPVQASHGDLVDTQGRTVVLRGVNVRAAGFFDNHRDYIPLPPFGADDCRVLGEDLGMNQLRLAINWSYLEPTRGTFDAAYVDRILQIAADCELHGVYTLVDLHQDGWSKYVGYDGAPFWAHQPALPASAVDESAGAHDATSSEVQAAMAGFFADRDGLVADYASMAGRLAALIDRAPGIIGLELMNEPMATASDLAGFHAAVASAVRAAAPGLPVYFEPNALRNVLDLASPRPLPVDNVVYAPHLYTGVFQGNWMVGQDARIDDSIQHMLSEARTTDAALVVTEFGNHPVDPTGSAWLTAALTLLDRHAVSASFWVYEEWPSTCGQPSCWGLYDEAAIDDGAGAVTYRRTLRPEAVTLLARAFPQAIAGELESFAYDPASRTLTVHLRGAAGTHVLAAPRLVYGDDIAVTCDGRPTNAIRRGGRVEVSCPGTLLVLAPATQRPGKIPVSGSIDRPAEDGRPVSPRADRLRRRSLRARA